MSDLVKKDDNTGLMGLLHGKGGLTIPKPFEHDIFLFDSHVAGTMDLTKAFPNNICCRFATKECLRREPGLREVGSGHQHYGAVLELVFADKEMSCYLDVLVKCPLLLVASSNYDQNGEFAFHCRQYIVGTKFKFMV